VLHAAAHAQQPFDPDEVAALLLPPREPPRRGRWLLFAVAVHAAAVLALVQVPAPRTETERIVRVQLVPMAIAPAPGPPAPAAAPASPAPERPAPPRRVAARPAPRPPAPRAFPAPAATPKPVESAPAASPEAESNSSDGSGGANVDVASAPPAGGPGTGAGDGAGPGGGDEIAAYLARIHALLSRHQRYPAMARRRGLEGSVLLQLRIGADGRIESARAGRGAPKLFARSALDAVDRAGRFPAPPGGPLAIEVPLRFQLEN
jgi:protein TonB